MNFFLTKLLPRIIAIVLTSSFLFACKKETGEPQGIAKKYNIKGKVEKGPFIKGTKLTIQELDKDLTPTGKVFHTAIVDDEGSFSINNLELKSSLVEIIADGYFYDEVLGELSSGPITLTSLADLSEEGDINVNILTHITKSRIERLMEKDQLMFVKAREKAQNELFSIFGLQEYSTKRFNSFTITSGTAEASSQIVVSSILLDGRSPAQFTEFVFSIANQFKADGTVTAEIKKQLWETSVNLDYARIEQKLHARYASLNKELQLVNLSRFVDWNNDGIAGNELGNIGEDPILKFELDTLKVVKEGGIYKVKINSNIPYKEYQDKSLEDNFFSDMYTDISITQQSMTDNELALNIAPSSGMVMGDKVISISSYDNQVKASIVIRQEGDINRPPQGTLGAYLSGMLRSVYKTLDLNYTAEAVYTQSFNLAGWNEFYQKAITPNTSKVGQMFTSPYQAIRIINQLLEVGNDRFPSGLRANLLALRSILYYQMMILWGNVHYVTKVIGVDINEIPKQISQFEMLQQLKASFAECRSQLASQKSNIGLPNSMDIPSHMLAKVLINQRDYSEALVLLENIINSKRYALSIRAEDVFLNGNSELIYSLYIENPSEYKRIHTNAAVIPVIRLTETYMLASECALYLNKKDKLIQFLNQIETGRSRLPKFNASSTIDIQTLKEVWKSELPSDFSYFDFLKRNNLAESELNLSNSSYKLLLPIPMSEVANNPNTVQNPGY
ncbi:hypothetical protein ABDK00_010780 [Niabella insulamsoli]|uniref:hypothetical protein n=1 Tax=Niabella insulamsoli TaxID=3144874 RepID=UPI0031FCDF35